MDCLRYTIKNFNAILAIIVLALCSLTTNAAGITYGCSNPSGYIESCTLQELFDGGYFEIEGLQFSNWQFVSSSYTTPTAPDPSSMIIEIFDSASIDDWIGAIGDGPGFRFIDEEGINGAEYREFTYSFEVSTLDSNQQLTSNSLLIGGFGGTADAEGYLEVNELVSDSLDNDLGSKNIFADPPFNRQPIPTKDFDIIEFLPQSLISIETQLSENGDSSNDPSDSLDMSSYWQRYGYTVVPIPPTFLLFGTGLLALVGITRRKKAA